MHHGRPPAAHRAAPVHIVSNRAIMDSGTLNRSYQPLGWTMATPSPVASAPSTAAHPRRARCGHTRPHHCPSSTTINTIPLGLSVCCCWKWRHQEWQQWQRRLRGRTGTITATPKKGATTTATASSPVAATAPQQGQKWQKFPSCVPSHTAASSADAGRRRNGWLAHVRNADR